MCWESGVCSLSHGMAGVVFVVVLVVRCLSHGMARVVFVVVLVVRCQSVTWYG